MFHVVRSSYSYRGTSAEELNRPCDYESEAFERFWEEYPNKLFKLEAKKAWDRRRLSEPEIARMMAYVKTRSEREAWAYTYTAVLAFIFLSESDWRGTVIDRLIDKLRKSLSAAGWRRRSSNGSER